MNHISLQKLLKKIQARPGMYLYPEPWIDALPSFLAGWKLSRLPFEDEQEFEALFFKDFHKFVRKKYDEHSTRGWHDLIKGRSVTDAEALNEFFILLNEFENSLCEIESSDAPDRR